MSGWKASLIFTLQGDMRLLGKSREDQDELVSWLLELKAE